MTSGAASTPTASAGGSPSDGAWNSAQCYHLWMLAHRQLYGGQAEAALRTAQWLGRYGEVLPQEQVAAFQALAAYYAGYYGQASKVRRTGMCGRGQGLGEPPWLGCVWPCQLLLIESAFNTM